MQEDLDKLCTKCGDCCRQFSVFIIPENQSLSSLQDEAAFYSFHENTYAKVTEPNKQGIRAIHITFYSKCSSLVEHRDGTTSCKIYDVRPEKCRDYPSSQIGETIDSITPDIPNCPPLDKVKEINSGSKDE